MEPNPKKKPRTPPRNPTPQPSTPKAPTPPELPDKTPPKTPTPQPSPCKEPPSTTPDNPPAQDQPNSEIPPQIQTANEPNVDASPENPVSEPEAAAASVAETIIPNPPKVPGKGHRTKVMAKKRKLRKLLSNDEEEEEERAEGEPTKGVPAGNDASQDADQELDAALKAEAERIAAARAALEMVKKSVLGNKESSVDAVSAVADVDTELPQSKAAATPTEANAGKEPVTKKARVAKFPVKRGAKTRSSPRTPSGRPTKP